MQGPAKRRLVRRGVPRRLGVVAVAAAMVVLGGCSSGDVSAPASGDTRAADTLGSGDEAPDSEGGVQVLDADAAVDLLATRDDVTVIDVRTPEEHADGYLDGALLLDLAGGTFAAEVEDLDRDTTYLLYCRTGVRSAEAAAMMADLGFAEAYDAGGYADLVAAGAPAD